ncbi:DNA cytosine methyltransferase [Croceicoccus gelatinilyticus]|uniref:DNA cytosine methyltransferase n=1 Tax=Croceicoccus gelatinilyticus TaxID=2835536 RepID=UPI001BD0A949|nr:DNA cytosine methyltransferase [Croceicoccus gelatinilyticus]MBS7671630.1 DNA cytosine methyltransferase [Croceicoccus gelatinilyticus]
MTEDVLVRVNVPDIATKQLKFRDKGGRRILTISSNLLTLFGFSKGDAVVERSLGPGKGMTVERVDDLFAGPQTKKVYARTYKQRRNNPLEHMIEVSSQRLIDEAFPEGCNRVHILFQSGKVTITPIFTIEERARANAGKADPDSVFAALTSGVDLHSMQTSGFSISAVLEWRPQEARDKTNLTETGAMTALANSGPLYALFNEDVTSCVLDHIGAAMAKNPPMIFHASPQCDDLSNLKAKSLKERDLETTDSTADMIIDLLAIIEKIAPPVVVFENVPGMIGSPAYEVASLRLRRWGYTRHEHVGDARDYGGLTSRKRAYVVFTLLNAPFAFEEPYGERERDAWAVIEPFLDQCRDVSHSKSLNDGKEIGRLRAIKPGARNLPTPVKSIARMAKDSIVIEPEDGKFLFPSEALFKHLLGIDDVDLNAVSATIATEIIGQSIDRPHHEMIMRSVRRHIAAWREASNDDDNVGMAA